MSNYHNLNVLQNLLTYGVYVGLFLTWCKWAERNKTIYCLMLLMDFDSVWLWLYWSAACEMWKMLHLQFHDYN